MIGVLLSGAAALGAFVLYEVKKGAVHLPPTLGPIPLTPLGAQSGQHTTVHVTVAQQVASNGRGRTAALALYSYLRANGADNSSTMRTLVLNFQSAHNSDPQAVSLTGTLPVTGAYDAKTSAALTLYTHDPIAPALPPVPAPPPPQSVIMNGLIPGAAATSGFNLYVYLTKHPNNPADTNLQRLVMQFQLDVNTDPKFPGPAPGAIPPILVENKLRTDGIYDNPTATALAVMAPTRINP